MCRIPQDRLGIYYRLGYEQNTTGQVGYISYTGLRTEYHRTGWVYIIDWAMHRIPQYRLGIYHRLSYVQNTIGEVG
jgi:hypothetical protein